MHILPVHIESQPRCQKGVADFWECGLVHVEDEGVAGGNLWTFRNGLMSWFTE